MIIPDDRMSALYLGHDPYDARKGNDNPGGVHLFDQWNGAAIARRVKLYSKDANAPGATARRAWTELTGRH